MYKIFETYKKANSGLINKEINKFESISCPLCGEKKGYKVYSEDGGIPDQKIWCMKCGLIYKNRIWTAASNDKFYNEYYLSHYFNLKLDGEYGAKTFFEYGVRRSVQVKAVKDILEKAKKPIEIGCSSGGVLSELVKVNPNSIGVDIDAHAVEYAKKMGLNAKKMDLFKTKEKFDFIWSSHVFEHLLDISSFTKAIENIAYPKANLVLIVPDSQRMPELPHTPHTFNFFTKQFIQIIEKNSNFRAIKTIDGIAQKGDKDIFVVFKLNKGSKVSYPEFKTTKEEYLTHMKNLSLASVKRLRIEYDDAMRLERKRFTKEYKEIKSQHKWIQIRDRLIWSKLYILFTFKWLTKR